MVLVGIPFDILLSVLPAVVLFLYGIEHFSKEILKASGDFFRSTVHKLTKTPFRGLVSGMIVTSIVQSSTATTIIAIGLVNAGLISFSQSLGVIFGANIGTAVTAQLVALKLTAFAPIFIVIGFVVDIIGGKYKFIGKPLFYFGLVFFSLTLLASAVQTLKNDPQVLGLFSHFTNPLWGIFVGFLVTNLFQSSSVTTGIVVVFAQGGLIGFNDALLLILGANIGTTVTTLLASTRMDLAARRAATAHFLFNVLGVALILPFLPQFSAFVQSLGGDEGQMVANAHMLFNISAALLFLLVINQFEKIVKKIVPGEEKEIVLTSKYLNNELPKDNEKAFELVEKEIVYMMEVSRDMYDEVIHAIQTKKDCRSRVDKLEAYTDLLDDHISMALLKISQRNLTKDEAERAVLLTRISNQLEQFADSIKIISNLYSNLRDRGVHLSSESAVAFLNCSVIVRENLELLENSFHHMDDKTISKMRQNDDKLRSTINIAYKEHIKRMQKKATDYGSLFIEMLSILDNANDRLRNIRKMLQ